MQASAPPSKANRCTLPSPEATSDHKQPWNQVPWNQEALELASVREAGQQTGLGLLHHPV